jgi:hypothetical protein
MTTKADFTPQEWELVLEGPPSAGMIVIAAQRGGMLRETVSMAKAYVEARQQHGQSELLDEIVAAKPKLDHTRYRSPEELKEHSLGHLRGAVALLQGKVRQRRSSTSTSASSSPSQRRSPTRTGSTATAKRPSAPASKRQLPRSPKRSGRSRPSLIIHRRALGSFRLAAEPGRRPLPQECDRDDRRLPRSSIARDGSVWSGWVQRA